MDVKQVGISVLSPVALPACNEPIIGEDFSNMSL